MCPSPVLKGQMKKLLVLLFLMGCDAQTQLGGSSCLLRGPVKLANVKVYGAQNFGGVTNLRLVKRTSSVLPRLGAHFQVPIAGADVVTNGGGVSDLMLDAGKQNPIFPVTLKNTEELAIEFYEQIPPPDLKLTCDFILAP